MISFTALLPLTLCALNLAQESSPRGIVPAEFAKARPAKGTPKSPGSPSKGPVYRQIGIRPARANNAPLAQLGLTIWRLRPATATDTGARILVQNADGAEEWTPQRIAANTPLQVGERLRFSFESPQTGYLYVIDRELYADGSQGEPYLIFPTLRTRGGDNKVEAGKLIEIPGQEDQPNYFRLKQLGKQQQVGELLTVIVAAKSLTGITIGPKELPLTSAQVNEWETQWSAQTETFELAGGAGKTWTKAEQEAGAQATRHLTQEDPSPQTVYRVATKPGAPLLVKVGLRYGKSKAGTRARVQP